MESQDSLQSFRLERPASLKVDQNSWHRPIPKTPTQKSTPPTSPRDPHGEIVFERQSWSSYLFGSGKSSDSSKSSFPIDPSKQESRSSFSKKSGSNKSENDRENGSSLQGLPPPRAPLPSSPRSNAHKSMETKVTDELDIPRVESPKRFYAKDNTSISPLLQNSPTASTSANRNPLLSEIRKKAPMVDTETSPVREVTSKAQSLSSLVSPAATSANSDIKDNEFESLLIKLAKKDRSANLVLLGQNAFFVSAVDGVSRLATALAYNDYVTDVDLRSSKLGDEDIKTLCTALLTCSNLKSLYLQSNVFSSAGVLACATLIEKHDSLVTLKLSHQMGATISLDAERSLINALSRNSVITNLDYNFDPIKSTSEIEALRKLIVRNQNIKSKKIKFVQPSEYPYPASRAATLYALVPSSSSSSSTSAPTSPVSKADIIDKIESPSEKSLYERRSLILPAARRPGSTSLPSPKGDGDKPAKKDEDEFEELLRKLKLNDAKLKELSFKREKGKVLASNEDNYARLALALTNNSQVTSIDLNFVKMVDSHLIKLCEAFPTCTRLEKINIGSNNISTAGIIAFANMIEKHRSITTVILEGQFVPVGPEAEKALINALSQNPRLISLAHVFRDQTAKGQYDSLILRNVNMASFKTTASFTPPVYPYPDVHAKYTGKS